MKKLLILLICLIVQKYGYCQTDTVFKIKQSVLAKIYTDLTVCETSLNSCKEREVFYLNEKKIFLEEKNIATEIMYNDSIIIVDIVEENNFLREDKKNCQNLNKNLVKSNKLFKLLTVSGWSGFAVLLLIIAI